MTKQAGLLARNWFPRAPTARHESRMPVVARAHRVAARGPTMGDARRLAHSGRAARGALTFELHADVEALLEAAEGAALPLRLVDVAAAVGHARVDLFVLHGSLEEALAGLAREQAVVVARHLVAAHGAQFLDALLGVRSVRVPVAVLRLRRGPRGAQHGAWGRVEERSAVHERGHHLGGAQ